MKRVFSVLIAGCVLGALTVIPATASHAATNALAAAPSLALITGIVRDDQGAPIAGALVALHEPQRRGKQLKSVTTDLQGRFEAGIAPGLYYLRATALGFTSSLTRVDLNRAARVNHDFALKRTDTLIQQRGDSDDYRWIARSAPRHAMNLDEVVQEDTVAQRTETPAPIHNSFASSFHGAAQFIAAGAGARGGLPAANFFGTNFAVSGSLGGNFEMAVIGQQGTGQLAPQRLAAIATMRPADNHQVTASVGYGQVALARRFSREFDLLDEPMPEVGAPLRNAAPLNHVNAAALKPAGSLEQLSVSATASWQVFQPLLVIYGFDYSRFIGSAARRNDSVLPRFAVQYSPSARLRLNAAATPGTDGQNPSTETFNTENIQATFENSAADIAFTDAPLLDRSRRFEAGFERLFGDGNSSVEASGFYDLVSGHGVGVLALPLEASLETQAAFQQVAHQVAAMNGAARGVRVIYNRRFNEQVTASAGYSFGRGSRFNGAPLETLTPAEVFRGGFFHVATAKLDLDFTSQTGTHISTVIRLSPAAVVFAIDPFAGRMSVYDPNINIYVTQELPSFGLPVRWEALVDVRNLLDQAIGVEEGAVQLIAARARRTVRGGVAFRW